MLTAGICGIGSFYSNAFADSVINNKNLKLSGYAHLEQADEELKLQRRLTKKEWGKKYNVKGYSKVEDMIEAENIDVVFVAAPDNIKAENAVKAANQGCHVYMAKPMCKTLDEADKMLEAQKANDVLISPLLPARYDGAIRSMYEKVSDGAIGDVLTVRAWIQHGCHSPDFVYEGSPEAGPDQGGVNLSLGFYTADLILWVIDSIPGHVYAEYDNLATPHSIWMDTGKGIVRFKDGRMGSMDIIFNVSCGAPSWELEIVGTDGIARAHLDVMEGIIWHKEQPGSPRIFYRCQNDVIAEAVDYFTKACLEQSPLDTSLQHGRNVLELALAWTKSSESKAKVSLPL